MSCGPSLRRGGRQSLLAVDPSAGRFDQPGLRPLASIEARGGSCTGASSASSAPLEGRGADERIGSHDTRVRDLLLDAEERRLLSSTRPASFASGRSRGARLRTLRGSPPQRFTLPSLDRAGRRVAWASPDGALRSGTSEPPGGAPLPLPRGDSRTGGSWPSARDGRWLAAAGLGSAALLPLRLPHARSCGRTWRGRSPAFQPDSRLLVSCARDGARIWPLAPGGGGTSHRPGGRLLCYGARQIPRATRSCRLAVPGDLLGAARGGRAAEAPRLRRPAARPIAPRRSTIAADASPWPRITPPLGRSCSLYVLDLDRGTGGTARPRPGPAADPWAGHIEDAVFIAEGSLLTAGDGGIDAGTADRWGHRPDRRNGPMGRPTRRAARAPGRGGGGPAGRRVPGRHRRRDRPSRRRTGSRRPLTTHGRGSCTPSPPTPPASSSSPGTRAASCGWAASRARSPTCCWATTARCPTSPSRPTAGGSSRRAATRYASGPCPTSRSRRFTPCRTPSSWRSSGP